MGNSTVRSARARYLTIRVAAFVIPLVFHSIASATIMFTGASSISSFISTGSGVVSPQPAPPGSLFDTPDGLKVSSYDLSYSANTIDNGSALSISWIAMRPLTAFGGPTSFVHTDHLDGSVNYTAGFQLVDVTLRTITTQTDTDLAKLHLGALASGTSFDQTLTTGPFLQNDGNDHLLSYFTMKFDQLATATATDTIVLRLPSSAVSSATPVPLPSLAWLFPATLGILFSRRRRLADAATRAD